MATGGTKAVVVAMFANLGIAITKFVAYLLTASSSMLAEAVHSVADTSNQALLLLDGKRAQRAATTDHPFGYGRERYVYAFVVSIVLFSVGGLSALYEAWHKWLRTLHLGPEELLVAAKIAVSPVATGKEVTEVINAAEARVRAVVPIARAIYLEPDLRRPGSGEPRAAAEPTTGASRS